MGELKPKPESKPDLAIGPRINRYYPFPFVLPAATKMRGPDRPVPEDHWKVPTGRSNDIEGHGEDPRE